jgi:L-ascorbate metabolism protein UlaG (beta-lactamase superfamily)
MAGLHVAYVGSEVSRSKNTPMQITMIGHSTVLIETEGQRILTDPFFSGFGNLAYKRMKPPAKKREELAVVDLVLLSHGHFDHVDYRFLRNLPRNVPILANRSMFLSALRAGRNIEKAEVWRRYTFGNVAVTPVPAVHLAPTNGFVIESEGKTIYFAADTFDRPFMQEIRRRFTLDVALMPVTTFVLPMTMGEQEALRAVKVLEPTVVIPIHLGIQPRSPLLRTRQTPESFAQRLKQANSPTQVVILREGETWTTEVSRTLIA